MALQQFSLRQSVLKPSHDGLCTQAPCAQISPAPASQLLPQAPQLLVLESRSTSQPLSGSLSQSLKLLSQVDAHWPPAQVAVECSLETHALPQAPQFRGSELVGSSQPSAPASLQSAQPELHWETVHLAFSQPALALPSLQLVAQSPQCSGLSMTFVQAPLHMNSLGPHWGDDELLSQAHAAAKTATALSALMDNARGLVILLSSPSEPAPRAMKGALVFPRQTI
jgi:hypothetical protein